MAARLALVGMTRTNTDLFNSLARHAFMGKVGTFRELAYALTIRAKRCGWLYMSSLTTNFCQ